MRVKKRPQRWNGSNELSNSLCMTETQGSPEVAEKSPERFTGCEEPPERSPNNLSMLESAGNPSEDDEKSLDGSTVSKGLSKGFPTQPPYKGNRMSKAPDEKSADGSAGNKGSSKQLPYKSNRMSAVPGPPQDRRSHRDGDSLEELCYDEGDQVSASQDTSSDRKLQSAEEEGGHDDDDYTSVAEGTTSLGAAVHMEAKGQSNENQRKRRKGE